MGLFPRWRFFPRGAREAALEERIIALQSALVTSKAASTRWIGLRRGTFVAIATVNLGFGFVLGVYREPLKQAVIDFGVALGFTRPIEDTDSANAAYQKGDYARAVQIARPLAQS